MSDKEDGSDGVLQQPGVAGRYAPSSATPISRHVLRHYCPFCSRGHAHKRSAIAHVAKCWRNPASRSCKTCGCYQPPERADYYDGYPGCPEGCDAGLDLSGGLRTHCDAWEGALTDGAARVQTTPPQSNGLNPDLSSPLAKEAEGGDA